MLAFIHLDAGHCPTAHFFDTPWRVDFHALRGMYLMDGGRYPGSSTPARRDAQASCRYATHSCLPPATSFCCAVRRSRLTPFAAAMPRGHARSDRSRGTTNIRGARHAHLGRAHIALCRALSPWRIGSTALAYATDLIGLCLALSILNDSCGQRRVALPAAWHLAFIWTTRAGSACYDNAFYTHQFKDFLAGLAFPAALGVRAHDLLHGSQTSPPVQRRVSRTTGCTAFAAQRPSRPALPRMMNAAACTHPIPRHGC